MFILNLDTLTDELVDGERLDMGFGQLSNTFTLYLSWTDWQGTGDVLGIDRVFDLSQLDEAIHCREMVEDQFRYMLRQLREVKEQHIAED